MRALIIGGGPAGCAAAMALQQAGWDPAVYEAHQLATGADLGAYLTVAVNGVHALRRIGAADAVMVDGFPTGLMHFASGNGKQLGTMAIGPVLADGTATHTVRRADLYRRLHEETVQRGIPVFGGKRLVSASERGGVVTASFRDGSSADGELLVGADGLHSAARSTIDAGAPSPHYTGLQNAGGFTRLDGLEAESGAYTMVWGRECFFGYTQSPEGEVWWFANPPSRTEIPEAELRALTHEQRQRRLLTLLRVDRTSGARIVASTNGEIGLFNQYDLPRVPTWRRGAMVIIGDAAHAVSPASGQGCSLAFEDAVVLADCLRHRGNVERGVADFERRRRDRVERVVRWGSGMNNTKRQGLIGRALRDLALPLLLKRHGTPQELQKMAWLFQPDLGSTLTPVVS